MTAADFTLKYFGKLDDAGNVAVPPSADVFRTDVKVRSVIDPRTVTNGTRTENNIEKEYCATNLAAADLVKLLASSFVPPPVVIQDHPFAGWPIANQTVQTDNVPFLQFKGYNVRGESVTVQENAGLLASTFDYHDSPQNALLHLVAEIQQEMQATLPPEGN